MARAAVKKMPGVKDVFVDSTSVGVIRMGKADAKPDRKKIDEAIKRYGLKITSLEKVERNVPAAVYELSGSLWIPILVHAGFNLVNTVGILLTRAS